MTRNSPVRLLTAGISVLICAGCLRGDVPEELRRYSDDELDQIVADYDRVLERSKRRSESRFPAVNAQGEPIRGNDTRRRRSLYQEMGAGLDEIQAKWQISRRELGLLMEWKRPPDSGPAEGQGPVEKRSER